MFSKYYLFFFTCLCSDATFVAIDPSSLIPTLERELKRSDRMFRKKMMTDKLVLVLKGKCFCFFTTHACNFVFTAHFEPANSIFERFEATKSQECVTVSVEFSWL